MKTNLFLLKTVALLFLALSSNILVAQITQKFTYTGSNQTFTVPAGVTSLTVKMWGAGGAGSFTGGSGGSGAFVKGTLTVTPGLTYYIIVGGPGQYSGTTSSAGGFGGGGSSGGKNGGSGGGFSGIFSSSALTQSNAVVIAGGGGGAGYFSSITYGGGGGATTGSSGGNKSGSFLGGSGGTVTTGGVGGAVGNTSNSTVGENGIALTGGKGGTTPPRAYNGGGGGGGYYGGGGGYSSDNTANYSSGGGGGSSFLGTLSTPTNIAGTTNTTGNATQAPGNTETEYTSGIGNGGNNATSTAGGNGLVVISYSIPCPTFAATISIGGATTTPGSTYPSLTTAIADLSRCGISQATTLLLNASYNSSVETFPIVIPSITGASATNTVTIKPSGSSQTISGSNTTAIIKLTGADYIILDGSNSTGGTTKNLSINNTSASSSSVIWIASTTTDGATNNTIKNCIISGNSGTATVADIVVGGSTMGYPAEVSNNTITITNNTLSKAQNGIYALGNAGTPDQNWMISGNIIGSTIAAEKGYRGIAVQNATSFSILRNTISGVLTNTSSTSSGILVGAAVTNGVVSGNKISDVKNTNTSGYGSNGIYLNSTSLTANITVFNNMIWDVASYGYNAGSLVGDNGYGIIVTTGAGFKIYFNSINLNTNQQRGNTAALNIAAGVTASGAIDLRNNIFANNQTLNTRYAIYSAAPKSVYNLIDYNDYFSTGDVGYLGGGQATLQDFQTSTGQDMNSVSYNPPFVSAADLHITPNGCNPLESGATPIPGITADIDGGARSAASPDIGADEFIDTAPLKITSVTDGTSCGPASVILSAAGQAGTTQYMWYDAPSGGNLLDTNTGSFSTPFISATTTYYVAASSASCTGISRRAVTAYIKPVPNTIAIAPTVSPGGATGCDLNYVKLDITGLPPAVAFQENLNPPQHSWTKYGPVIMDVFQGIDVGGSNTANAGGVAPEWAFYNNGTDQTLTDEWSLYPDTGTIGDELPISLNGYSAAVLSFKSRFVSRAGAGAVRNIYVDLSKDKVNWTAIWSNENIANDITVNQNPNIDLSSYLGSVIYLRFRYAGDSRGLQYWYIDDILLDSTIPPVAWSPVTGLFTDVNLTLPYVAGSNAVTLYAAPDTVQTYTATTAITTCQKNAASASIVRTKKVFTGLSATPTLWNVADNWSTKQVPTADKCVYIPAGQNTVVDILTAVAKKVTVENGGTLRINANQALTLQDELINNNSGLDAADKVVIASDGNLIQINPTAPNAGSINAEREVTDMDNESATQMDYVYWSSPVLGQKTKNSLGLFDGFSPGTPNNRFFRYNEPDDRFYETGDLTFVPGKGYAVQAETSQGFPPNAAGYSKTYHFRGTPNNGDISFNINRSPDAGIVQHGFNLIGNPYPSNIDFNVLYANNSALIYKTVYFWSNNTYTPSQQGNGYAGNNYAVYTGTGGNPPTGGSYASAPNGIIKVGQGVIIQKKVVGGSASLVFKNSYGTGQDLRVSTSGTFYQKTGDEKDRFWLQLISPEGTANNQLIGYIEGATDSFEQDYDAEILGMSSDLFYSEVEDKKVLIQGKGDFVRTDRVKLGADFFKNGLYTIALDHAEGLFAAGQNIYLKDIQSGIVTNLSEGPYVFSAEAGVSDGRFEIIYEPETVLATSGVSTEDLIIYRESGDFVAQAKTVKIKKVEVYDLGGRLIYSHAANDLRVVIPAEKLPNNVYILRVTQNERVTNKKILK